MSASSPVVLERAMSLACDPRATDKERRTAVQVAYDLGKADGRLEGVKEMGEKLFSAAPAVSA